GFTAILAPVDAVAIQVLADGHVVLGKDGFRPLDCRRLAGHWPSPSLVRMAQLIALVRPTVRPRIGAPGHYVGSAPVSCLRALAKILRYSATPDVPARAPTGMAWLVDLPGVLAPRSRLKKAKHWRAPASWRRRGFPYGFVGASPMPGPYRTQT